jgi:hypothetical protein
MSTTTTTSASEVSITLADVGTIRTDDQGRFSLNDLHKAAGEESRHRPRYWQEGQQAQSLIAELDKDGIPSISAKPGVGTYVCKELVYAYAMWISAAFQLKVIRAFDALATGNNDKAKGFATARPTAIPAAAEFHALFDVARLIGLDTNAAAISANQAVVKITGTNLLQLMNQTHLVAENQSDLFMTPTELGKKIGVSAQKFNLMLAEAGLQAKTGESWAPTEKAEGLSRILDTGKRHANGTMIQQVKWAASVVESVRHLSAK